jgi:ribose 5-phosphate isomerase B
VSLAGQKPSIVTLLIAADHAGFELKEQLKQRLTHVQWIDLGPSNSNRVDYPDFADRVASQVAKSGARGVLICGSGQGMAMRANRYNGVRAALAWSEDSARLAREHNDANILCLGARFVSADEAEKMIEIFNQTPFEGGRHEDRVKKLGLPTDDAC